MDDNHDCEHELNEEVTVVDVYDIASEIGKECEKIIDQYGPNAMTSLMPKVINALELLENLATRNERENSQLNELELKISQLENDKLEKAEYRKKFEQELEIIEEQWRTETKELVAMVSRLQEENKRLLSSNTLVSNHQIQVGSMSTSQILDEDDMLQKLKQNVEKQRDEIRMKDKMLDEKILDIENLKSQVERLNSSSKELRRKHKLFQNQVRSLCDERADFLVQLQDQHRDIMSLRQRLGLAQKENEDLVKSDVKNDDVYNVDDPNRPRFTIQELKDILHERNELKARVSDLEDELQSFRPKDTTSETPNEQDAPVQGPLPCEPDDAPWKKHSSESGIRKFFRKIFSENSGSSNFPRRSFSTLSKMALSATTTSSSEQFLV